MSIQNGVIQVAPDSTGARVDNSKLLVELLEVFRQRINISDAEVAAAIAKVFNTQAVGNEYGLAVREVGLERGVSIRTDDLLSDTTYIGEAVPGSNDSDPVWRILKIIDTSNSLIVTYADGNDLFDNKWTDRLTLDYS